MGEVTEDDIYRSSTQFKLWSFLPETLASMRASTNALAADGVKAAIASLHRPAQDASAEGRAENETDDDKKPAEVNIDCLTVEEEQKLVGFYCVKAMQLADFCDFPTNVKVSRMSYVYSSH